MIVVDASVLVEVLLRLPDAERLTDRLFDEDALHAPQLLDVEVMQVLRRYAARGDVAPHAARQAIATLELFPLRRHAHQPLLHRMWELRDNVTAYDATYVALAEALDATLLTRDASLAAVPRVRARVEVV